MKHYEHVQIFEFDKLNYESIENKINASKMDIKFDIDILKSIMTSFKEEFLVSQKEDISIFVTIQITNKTKKEIYIEFDSKEVIAPHISIIKKKYEITKRLDEFKHENPKKMFIGFMDKLMGEETCSLSDKNYEVISHDTNKKIPIILKNAKWIEKLIKSPDKLYTSIIKNGIYTHEKRVTSGMFLIDYNKYVIRVRTKLKHEVLNTKESVLCIKMELSSPIYCEITIYDQTIVIYKKDLDKIKITNVQKAICALMAMKGFEIDSFEEFYDVLLIEEMKLI
jgi:hypothetical protein